MMGTVPCSIHFEKPALVRQGFEPVTRCLQSYLPSLLLVFPLGRGRRPLDQPGQIDVSAAAIRKSVSNVGFRIPRST
jgi:hypothetical protein